MLPYREMRSLDPSPKINEMHRNISVVPYLDRLDLHARARQSLI